jgi:hypothetical protein
LHSDRVGHRVNRVLAFRGPGLARRRRQQTEGHRELTRLHRR